MEQKDFERLYKDYVNQVFRFLYSLSGDYHIAEDLTQDTFLQAYTHLEDFRGSCRLPVWLCQIGKNLYYNSVKKNRRLVCTGDVEERKRPAGSPEEAALLTVTAKEILDCAAGLPEPYRTVFLFRVILESSYREIGEGLGQSEVWARVSYYRAKSMLMKRLKEEKHYEM